MFHRYIKLGIAALILGTSVWQFYERNIGNGIFLIFIMLLVILLYFKNEYILLAFLKLRKQDLAGAEKWLIKIKNPETALVRKQNGYYNYLMGIISSQRNLNVSEKYLKKALDLGLNMSADRAMAKLQLAGISMSRRRKIEASRLLKEAEALDKNKMLKEQIKIMKDNLKKI